MLDHRSNEELVRYEAAGSAYLEGRQLAREAKSRWLPSWLLMWGVGIGATIWAYVFNGAVSSGQMVLALALMAIVYGCFVFSVAELAAALPYTGGFYGFTRYAFDPLAGFICGVGLLMAYLLISALMAVTIGGYLSALLPGIPLILAWLLLYVIFVTINIRSTRWALTLALILTLLVIVLFSLIVVGNVSSIGQSLTKFTPSWHSSLSGSSTLFAALPLALWFYLGIEQIPLLAEESHEAARNLPKALKAALATGLLLSFMAVIGGISEERVTSMVEEGSFFAAEALSPLLFIAMLATFQAMMVAYARLLFALSRAGYFPQWLSLTSRYQTPNRALIMGSLVSLMIASLIQWRGGLSFSGAEMGNQTLLGAVVASTMLSYALVMASYIKLKRQHPNLPRPYTSPLGEPGAVVGFLGAIMILLAAFVNDAYRAGMVGMAFFLLFWLLYFFFVSSQRLVAEASEEKRALRASHDPVVLKRLIATRVILLLTVVGSIYALMRGVVATFNSPCPPQCGSVSLIREDLSGAYLPDANFVSANLLQADLSGADLRGADFSAAKIAEAALRNADLSDAKLIGANLSDSDLEGVILSSTDMSGATLYESNLTNVDLTKSTLQGVNLQQANLVGANLAGVNLAGVEFTSAQMKGANLAGANLAGSTLSDADLSGTNLTGADLAGAWLNKSNLTGANLAGADLSGASLMGANLTSAQLNGVQLVGANLIGATIARTNFRAANLKAVRWKESHVVERELLLDSILADLNELQLNELLKDAELSAIEFDSQTIWPSDEFYGISNNFSRMEEAAKDEDGIKVGLLHSHTGPLAISETPIRDATLLAIEEINTAGGVLGQRLIPIIKDGASDEAIFRQKARQLLQEEKVEVVFGGSRSRKTVVPIFSESNSLLFYPLPNEGFEQSPNIVYLGAEPTQQIIPATSYLLDQGMVHIFLLGFDDPFSHSTHEIIKAQLTKAGAIVTGEAYVPLDQTDFNQLIREMRVQTPPDAIINTMSGLAAVAFLQQFDKQSFTGEEITVMNASLSEAELALLEPQHAEGYLTTWSYYQTLPFAQNDAFVTAIKEAYGSEYTTSDPIHAGYFGLYLWKEMAEAAQSVSVDAIRKAIASDQINMQAPGGLIRLDSQSQHLYKSVRIGIVREDGLIEELVNLEQALKPDPFLTRYDWANDLSR